MDRATITGIVLLLSPFAFEAMMAFADYRTVRRESTDNVERLIPSQKIAYAFLIQSVRRLKQYAWFAWEIHGLTTAFALVVYFISERMIDHPAIDISGFWIVFGAMISGALFLTLVTIITISKPETGSRINSLLARSTADYPGMVFNWIASGFGVFMISPFGFLIFLGIFEQKSIREEIILYVVTYYFLFMVVTFKTGMRKEGVPTD